MLQFVEHSDRTSWLSGRGELLVAGVVLVILVILVVLVGLEVLAVWFV